MCIRSSTQVGPYIDELVLLYSMIKRFSSTMSFTPTTYVYKVIDNLSLSVDVFMPPDFSEETGVIVLHFHGGFLVNPLLLEIPLVAHWLKSSWKSRYLARRRLFLPIG